MNAHTQRPSSFYSRWIQILGFDWIQFRSIDIAVFRYVPMCQSAIVCGIADASFITKSLNKPWILILCCSLPKPMLLPIVCHCFHIHSHVIQNRKNVSQNAFRFRGAFAFILLFRMKNSGKWFITAFLVWFWCVPLLFRWTGEKIARQKFRISWFAFVVYYHYSTIFVWYLIVVHQPELQSNTWNTFQTEQTPNK